MLYQSGLYQQRDLLLALQDKINGKKEWREIARESLEAGILGGK